MSKPKQLPEALQREVAEASGNIQNLNLVLKPLTTQFMSAQNQMLVLQNQIAETNRQKAEKTRFLDGILTGYCAAKNLDKSDYQLMSDGQIVKKEN